MGSLENTTERVAHAIHEGSKQEGLLVDCHLEQYGNTDKVSLFVFGDAFKDETPGNRHVRVMRWVKNFAPEVQGRIGNVLVLTHQEVDKLQEQLPSSGAILGLG